MWLHIVMCTFIWWPLKKTSWEPSYHVHLRLFLLQTEQFNVSAKLKTKWTEVFFCNLIKRRKKREKKKGEGKREGRDALLITEPSAKSWRVANSTGSWDRGMGEGGRGREEGGRRAWGGCVVEEGNRRGGNRVSREQMWERKKWGTIRTLKLLGWIPWEDLAGRKKCGHKVKGLQTQHAINTCCKWVTGWMSGLFLFLSFFFFF